MQISSEASGTGCLLVPIWPWPPGLTLALFLWTSGFVSYTF